MSIALAPSQPDTGPPSVIMAQAGAGAGPGAAAAANNRRGRSNSFRGKVMHDNIRGQCEVVGAASDSEDSGASSGEGPPSAPAPGLSRKGSSRPQTGRYKSTLSIREAINKRNEEMFQQSTTMLRSDSFEEYKQDKMRHKPTALELDEFKLLIHTLDMEPQEFEKLKANPEKKADIESLERMAIRFFTYFEGREREHAKLTTSEFELKSIVDDILVRLLYPDAEPHYEKGEPPTTAPAAPQPTAPPGDEESPDDKPRPDPTQSMLTVDAKTLMKRSPKKKTPSDGVSAAGDSKSAPNSPNLGARVEDGGAQPKGAESPGLGRPSSPGARGSIPPVTRNITPIPAASTSA